MFQHLRSRHCDQDAVRVLLGIASSSESEKTHEQCDGRTAWTKWSLFSSRWQSCTATALLVILLDLMTGAVQNKKQQQEQNPIRHDILDIFPPEKDGLIVCFHVKTGGKSVFCVVRFTSAEFYGFGKRVERKQKGPFTAFFWCVCEEATTSLSADLPPCTSRPEWAGCTDSHAHTRTHTRILYTFGHGDTSDEGLTVFTGETPTRSHALDNMRGFFWSVSGFTCRDESVQEFRAERQQVKMCFLTNQCCEESLQPKVSAEF